MQLRSLALLCALTLTATAEIAVKSGEKIAFLGDSITQGGWSSPAGYVRLVIAGLEANGIKTEAVPAGISGHKSNDMLARLDRDVLSKNPQWMTLSCGVNDVWHGKNGVPLDEAMAGNGTYDKPETRGTYKANIGAIVDKAQAAGIKVVILTATVIHENLESPENAKLVPFNEYLRSLSREKKLPLADLNALFQQRLKAENQPGKKILTGDGVHMNGEGNKLMATGVLQAFGLDDAQLAKARDSWKDLEAKAAAEKAARDAEKARVKAEAEAKAKAEADAKAKPAAPPAPAPKL